MNTLHWFFRILVCPFTGHEYSRSLNRCIHCRKEPRPWTAK
jgi:hypothetical protein